MKTTTTLLEIIQSKAKREGYNAFFNKDTWQLRTQGDSLLTEVAQYSDFIRTITNEEIFAGFSLSDQNADKFFKRMFLNRFINREIKYQTLDLFRNQLVSLMASNNQWFCDVFKYYDDMFNGVNRGSQNSGQNKRDETRTANATLPQDNTKLDLDSNIVPYADSTDYSHGKEGIEAHSSSNSSSNSPSVITQLNNVYTKKLDEFDAKLFLQIW